MGVSNAFVRTAALLIFVILSGCQTTGGLKPYSKNSSTSSYDVPSYSGPVSPINSPIQVRYRPYPRSPLIKNHKMWVSEGAQKGETVTETRGNISSVSSGPNITQIVELTDMVVSFQGRQKRTNIPGNFKLILNATTLGEILSMDVEFADVQKTIRKNDKDQPKEVWKLIMMPNFSDEGVVSGQEIFRMDEKTSRHAKDLLEEMDISRSGTIRGLTNFRGRDAIVVDFAHSFNFGNKRLKLVGYGLMDSYSAAWVYSDMVALPQRVGDAQFTMAYQEVQEIKLDPSTPKASSIISVSVDIETRTKPDRFALAAPRKNNTPADTTGRTPPVTTITPPVSFKNVSSTRVCIMALAPPSQRLDWDRRSEYEAQVQEAKRRGLTLRQCRDLTGRQTEIASSTAPKVTQKPTPSPDLVIPIQKRLVALGYDTGSADGVMGRRTRNAIEAFQHDESLVVTGKVTETLARLLETKLASRQKLTEPLTKTVAPTAPIAPRVVADLGTFHALVIGNDAYRSLPRLRTAVKDAHAVAELLESRYGFRASTLTNATRAETIQALQKLRRELTERDNLLIYYAGHGKLDRGADRGYWLPTDADEDSQVNWINNITITDTLKAIRAKHVMVVADSCYSGTLTRDTRGVEVRPKESDYITKTHRKKSRTVLASGGLEPVSDSGGSGHSVFAKAFMDALRDNQGIIDGLDVFAYVRKQVRLNARQVPNYANILYAGHEVGGDFLFARKLE